MTEITAYSSNLFIEAVDNVVALIGQFSTELGVIKIYDADEYSPETPTIAVLFTDSDEEDRTQTGALNTNLGKARKTVYIYLEIWYYHEQFSASTNMREVTRKLWEISDILRRHPSILKFSASLGSEVTGSKAISRLRGNVQGGSSILAGGVVTLTIKVPISVESQG